MIDAASRALHAVKAFVPENICIIKSSSLKNRTIIEIKLSVRKVRYLVVSTSSVCFRGGKVSVIAKFWTCTVCSLTQSGSKATETPKIRGDFFERLHISRLKLKVKFSRHLFWIVPLWLGLPQVFPSQAVEN